MELDVAERRVVDHEAEDGEDPEVLGQAGCRPRPTESVPIGRDRGELQLELAAVDATRRVDVVGDRLVGRLVVAVVDVDDVAERLEVDVGHAERDRVVGDAVGPRVRRGRWPTGPSPRRRRCRRCAASLAAVVAAGAGRRRAGARRRRWSGVCAWNGPPGSEYTTGYITLFFSRHARLSDMDSPHRLLVDHLVAPLGTSAQAPRLSWWLPDGAARQEAFALQTREWDSGRVEDDRHELVAVRRPADDLAPAGRVAGQGLDRPRRERLVGLVVVGGGPGRPRRLVRPVDRPARARPAARRRAARPPAPPCLRPRRRCRVGPRVRHRARPLRAVPQRHPGRRPRADPGIDRLPVPARRADLRRHRPARTGRQRPRRRAERRVVAGQGRLHPRGGLLRDRPGAARPARGRARGRHPGHPRHGTGLDQRHRGDRQRRPDRRPGRRSPPPSGRLGPSRLRRRDLGRGPGGRGVLSTSSRPRRRRPSGGSRSFDPVGRPPHRLGSPRRRPRPEHQRLGPPAGPRSGRHHLDARPRRAAGRCGRGDDRPPPSLRLRHPRAASGRPGGRRGLPGPRRRPVRAPPHDPRLPVRRHRGAPGAARPRRRDRRRRPHRPRPDRVVLLQRRPVEPAARGRGLELPGQRLRRAHGLPAAGAGGLDR